MPDIEERLRAAMATLADEVPRSIHARAELDRRLTARRRTLRRAPALAAAAAAVVIAGVAVPIALDQGPQRSGLNPTTTSNQPTASSPPDSADILADFGLPPYPIVSVGDGTERRHLAIGQSIDDEFCFLVLDADERTVTDPVCEPVPTWRDGHMVEYRSLAELATRLPMPPALEEEVADQTVFITAPQVTLLDVRRGNGIPVNPSGGWEEGFYWSLADFDGPSDGFGYTASDVNSNILEQGTI